MNTYHIHLMLEALCKLHSLEELQEDRHIASGLMRNLGVTEKQAVSLVEGAYELKLARTGRHQQAWGSVVQ